MGNEEGRPPRGAGWDGGSRTRTIRPGTIGAVVVDAAEVLALRGGIAQSEAVREAREIVAALLDVPRFWPTANAAAAAEPGLRARSLAAAAKRAAGAPLAYAVGRACFRHLTLDVDERVLIPRPETEVLVDLVLATAAARTPGGLAVDVGTGSGAIALALATEASFERVIATDVSLDALSVAGANTALVRASGALRANVELRHGSLLRPLSVVGERVNVVVSNPPYIAFEEAAALPASVRDWEPPVALFSGAEGLEVTARLVREAEGVLEGGGLLALEVDARRASLVAELVAQQGAYRDVAVRLDLAGRERFVLATRV